MDQSIKSIELGQRVKSIRNELNLTQEEFGKRIGVQNHVIYNLESGRNKTINEPMLISLCSEYKINKDWLLYGSGDKYIKSKDSVLEELKSTYGLSEYAMLILESYLELSDNEKKFFDSYLKNLTDKLLSKQYLLQKGKISDSK